MELTLEASFDICSNSDTFKANIAHSVYMQGIGRHADAAEKYEDILKGLEMKLDSVEGSLLLAESMVLANLCVCYITTSQSDKAEELIRRIEDDEVAEYNKTGAQSLHSCIVHLVIGTLYCSELNFDTGLRLVMKALAPI